MANIFYQIALLDAAGSNLVQDFQEKLESAFRERGLDPAETLRFFEGDSAMEMEGNCPRLAVFFGGTGFDDRYNTTVGRLQTGGTAVIPVVGSLDDYTAKVPKALYPVNGMAVASVSEVEVLVGWALEEFRLLRAKRRLFLSYKRSDCDAAALQLYRRFDDRFFDAFLDTHSLRQGTDFQEGLWHRMADSDVVVLLYTETLFESEWVRQELGRASQMGLRVL